MSFILCFYGGLVLTFCNVQITVFCRTIFPLHMERLQLSFDLCQQ